MERTSTRTSGERHPRPDRRLILSGALLMVLGVLFIVVPKAAGRASAIYLGLLLALTGVVAIIVRGATMVVGNIEERRPRSVQSA